MRKEQTPIRVFLGGIRLKNGESMRDMAQRIGCTPSYLGNVEKGISRLSDRFIKKIREEYALSEEEGRELDICACISANKCIMDISALDYEARKTVAEQVLGHNQTK